MIRVGAGSSLIVLRLWIHTGNTSSILRWCPATLLLRRRRRLVVVIVDSKSAGLGPTGLRLTPVVALVLVAA